LAALQWVRRNVAAFGGDPNRVTVLGHDTGAALVNLLLISTAAKGKFGRLCSSSVTRVST
jgi:neuroligin